MRSGIALKTIRTEIAIEAGFSTDSGHLAYSAERLNQMINRVERMMANMDEWPTRNNYAEATVTADTQFHTLPTSFDFTGIDTAWCQFGSEWLEVKHGITQYDRSLYSATQRAEPVRKWMVRQTDNTEFEVWPIPGTQQTMRFEGSVKLGSMAADGDVCILDADIIVMRVAAQILGRDKKDDAALLLDNAQKLTQAILKRQTMNKSGSFSLSAGLNQRARLRPGIDYIPPV